MASCSSSEVSWKRVNRCLVMSSGDKGVSSRMSGEVANLLSQRSPMPSSSESCWSLTQMSSSMQGSESSLQGTRLTEQVPMKGPSGMFGQTSHALPTVSWSPSDCVGFGTSTQLSTKSWCPSPSLS